MSYLTSGWNELRKASYIISFTPLKMVLVESQKYLGKIWCLAKFLPHRSQKTHSKIRDELGKHKVFAPV